MQSWLVLTIPLFVVCLALLIRVALGLVRATRASVVAAEPLTEHVTFMLGEPGEYALYGEGKRFSSDFAGLDFVMRDASGAQITLAPVLMRSVVSSFDRVRLQLRRFSLAVPGAVTISVRGIRAESDAGNRLVVARPMLGRLVATVLALIVLGTLTLASMGGSIAIAILSSRRPPS